MGINGSYSISVWVYLDGYAYLCFGLVLRLMSTLIRRRLIQYEFFLIADASISKIILIQML